MKKIDKVAEEFFDFFETLGQSLDDNRISFREGLVIAPKLADFVFALRQRGNIRQEWKGMTNQQKVDIITKYLTQVKNIALKHFNEVVELYAQLMEKAVNILNEFSESFIIVRQIREYQS
jgi:hypothetical protein